MITSNGPFFLSYVISEVIVGRNFVSVTGPDSLLKGSPERRLSPLITYIYYEDFSRHSLLVERISIVRFDNNHLGNKYLFLNSGWRDLIV